MSVQRDLDKLLVNGVISSDTAEAIRNYYKQNKASPLSVLVLLFTSVGSILVALGLILIFAHNWDQIPRPIKVSFSFLMLLLGQALCIFALLKKKNALTNVAWRESSASFLFFMIAGSISLISQVYHMGGDFQSFLLSWLLLGLPLVYLMRSSLLSLLYLRVSVLML